jgi:hypothetical protein
MGRLAKVCTFRLFILLPIGKLFMLNFKIFLHSGEQNIYLLFAGAGIVSEGGRRFARHGQLACTTSGGHGQRGPVSSETGQCRIGLQLLSLLGGMWLGKSLRIGVTLQSATLVLLFLQELSGHFLQQGMCWCDWGFLSLLAAM